MVEITYNIDNFNLYVTTQVEQLAARGESSSDLLINLFAAYLSVPDRKFVEYVEKQKNKFDEGRTYHQSCSCRLHLPSSRTGPGLESGKPHLPKRPRSMLSTAQHQCFDRPRSKTSRPTTRLEMEKKIQSTGMATIG
jgi:hypothetical protein